MTGKRLDTALTVDCRRVSALCRLHFVIDSHNANEMQSNVNTLACSLRIIMRPTSRPTSIHIYILDIYVYVCLYMVYVCAICLRFSFWHSYVANDSSRPAVWSRCTAFDCCCTRLHVPLFVSVRSIVHPTSPQALLFNVCLPACIIQQSKKRQLSGEYCFLFALQLPFSIAWRITRKHTHIHIEREVCTTKQMPQKGPQVQTTNMHPAPRHHVLQGKQFSICNLLTRLSLAWPIWRNEMQS